jgi:lactoylglutathione lyase
MAASLNHVSIQAIDIERSARFYEDVFGVERVPAPNFGFPVYWLRLGDLQLHLFHTNSPLGGNHHFGVEVDDVAAVVQRLDELGLWESEGFFSKMYEMPDGGVQIYFRDPAGNLVEIDHPRLADLDPSIFAGRLERLADLFDQDEENMRATLFLAAREAATADRA